VKTLEGFPKDLLETIRLLENNPLKSYRDLAKIKGVSPQTFIRKVEELKTRGIIRDVHSSLRPESLYLERIIVVFTVSSLDEITYLELSCDTHPYTRQRNRIFGHVYGLLVSFDIPKGSLTKLKVFLKELKKRKYCEKYSVFKTEGRRIFYPHPFYNNIMDLDDFNIEEYFSKRINNKKNDRTENSSFSKETVFHPIHLLILRDITTNMRIMRSELLTKYQDYLNLKKSEENFYSLPKGFRPHLKAYFSDKKTQNAIYIDFKKKYSSIINNYIEYYWIGINRKYFEMFIRFAYIIYDISTEEKEGIFHLIENERPPFNIYAEDLGKDLLLTLSLPPYYQTKFAYLMKLTYSDFDTYQIDPFGYNAVRYRFYVHNYDLEKKQWKADNEWMITNVIKKIDERLSKKQFRIVSNKVG
jgi:DNA-binding Lrp family transcriptional regulator